MERFQICHQKLLLLDGSVQRNLSLWRVPLVTLAALVPGHHPCSHWLVVCKRSLGRSTLSSWRWLYFSSGNFLVNRQPQGCHAPFAVPAFPEEKVVEICVRQLVLSPSPCLDPSVALAAAVKRTLWAQSLGVSQQLPDSGNYNARRMADDLMPAESNTLWSYDLVQKAGGVGSPAGTWLKRLGEIRGDSVLLCISSTSITFSFSKSFHRAVAAIVLQTWCISIPTILTAVWYSHTASPSPSSYQDNEQLVWLQGEKKKCVNLDTHVLTCTGLCYVLHNQHGLPGYLLVLRQAQMHSHQASKTCVYPFFLLKVVIADRSNFGTVVTDAQSQKWMRVPSCPVIKEAEDSRRPLRLKGG